jgi:hypothetical protein
MGWECSAYDGDDKCKQNLIVTREEMRTLRRPRRRWEDNIKMDLREILSKGEDWNHLARDRDRWRALVNTVMNLRVP